MADPLAGPRSGALPPNFRFDIGADHYPRMYRRYNIGVRMSDGVTLSADLTLPGDQQGPVAEPLPVVVNFTPYNKMLQRGAGGSRLRALGSRIGASDRSHFTGRDLLHALAGGGLAAAVVSPTLVSRGYGYLMVDVRGTGTSTGKWDFFSEREQQDYLEVLCWVREQPWCNGRLAVTGMSYGALAAFLVAGMQPDGLAAVFAIEGGEDAVRELGITGGVPSPFMGIWIAAVNVLKWIPSIPGLVKTHSGWQFLRDRVTAPASWLGRAVQIALVENHPNLLLNDMWAGKLAQFDKITTPTWIHGGWHDVYNRSNFRIYDRITTAPGAKQVVVDDSYHSAAGSGFGAPDAPQYLDELQCAWFDRWVKGIDNGIDRYGPITIRRLGGGWISRDEYPEPAATLRRLYLSAGVSGSARHAGVDAALVDQAPEGIRRIPLPARRPSIRSNNTAIISTGLATLLGRGFGSDDRRAEAAAVTFSTEPFRADTVLSGPLNLHLRVESEGSDAFWSVTVTDVEPDGASAPITRGALLSSLRAVDQATSSYIDGELLIRAYRIGHARFLDAAMRHASSLEPDVRVPTIIDLVNRLARFIDLVCDHVGVAYEQERDRWVSRRSGLRQQWVGEVLAGAPVDLQRAEEVLEYRLDGRHLAAVVWADVAVPTRDVVALFDQVREQVAEELGAVGRPLMVPTDEREARLWFSMGSASALDQTRVRAALEARGIAAFLAFGDVAGGLGGFRGSLRRAERTKAVVLAGGGSTKARAAFYTEVAPIALMAGDLDELRAFVGEALGELSVHDERNAWLRETLREFLARNRSYVATAEAMVLHRNTIQYRVGQAMELCGCSFDDPDATDAIVRVQIALEVCRWMAPAVLRPTGIGTRAR